MTRRSQEYGYAVEDRDARALTGRRGPLMPRPIAPSPEHDSIYGDTYHGVPNPFVVVESGYPTRFHGPNFTVPQPAYGYALRPYAKAPFLGLGRAGMGAPLDSLSGSRMVDGLLGAVVGWLGSPTRTEAGTYALAGAAAGAMFGAVGIVGLMGAQLYKAQTRGTLRRDLRGD